MTLLNTANALAKHARHVVISALFLAVFLTGCQPEDSLSASDAQNNANVVNDGGASNDADFSDIAPTYVEGIAEAANSDGAPEVLVSAHSCDNAALIKAFKAQQSDRQVTGCGTIIKTLPDDNKGSRHQKILVELDGIKPQHTLLLVHNIDLAPRVADVARGTPVSFYGEYVYNNKGGLVHWTHHDPAARHQGGWIESNGVRYQ